MKKLFRTFIFAIMAGWSAWASAQNQTTNLTPVIPSNSVPFSIQIQAAFLLPSGLQSFVVGTSHGKWLLLAGRINGLHGFGGSNNFPPDTQNTTVFVVDPDGQTVTSRSLLDEASGLTQAQIDLLTVTGAQSYQSGRTLYMCGGYGADTATTNFTTKAALTAIDVPGLIHWVTNPKRGETAAQYIESVFDPMFQVSGGVMVEESEHHALLMFGEDFEGDVNVSATGTYSGQVRRFYIRDGKHLSFNPQSPMPVNPDANYFRTDLNVVPTIDDRRPGFTAFSGVFTPGFGVWTVPIEISRAGVPTMANPAANATFKQGMNNFACPTLELYSKKENAAYTVLMGGISYGFFDNGGFETDAELPFINQVTTIKRDASGNYSQCLMDGEYPVIASTGSNPGNALLFGAGATFIPADNLHEYQNGVLKLDNLKRGPVMVGYIVGGIQSTLPNTNTGSDTSASPYIFTVTLVPNGSR
jgi:hypothetical protein